MLQDRSGLLKCVVGRDAAVGPDHQNKFVVVGNLPNAGRFNAVLDETHGREEGVDRDNPNRLLFLLVLTPG